MTKKTKKIVRYPWERWLSKNKLKLVRGKHFDCMPHSMGVQIRAAAAQHGAHVSIRIQEDVLLVTIT